MVVFVLTTRNSGSYAGERAEGGEGGEEAGAVAARARARSPGGGGGGARTASKVIICVHDERFWLMTKVPMHVEVADRDAVHALSHDDVHGSRRSSSAYAGSARRHPAA